MAAAGGGRKAGRQLGVVGRTFFSPVFSKPGSPFPSCTPEPSLAASLHAVSPQWAEGKAPSLWYGLAGVLEGRWEARQRVRGEDSLTPPSGEPSPIHPQSHRGLSWESLGDLTPSIPTNRWEAIRSREVLGFSLGHTATNQFTHLIPIPPILAAPKQKPPEPTSAATTGSSVIAESKGPEPRGLVPTHSPNTAAGTPTCTTTSTSSRCGSDPLLGPKQCLVHRRSSQSGPVLHLHARIPTPFLHHQRQSPSTSCVFQR